MWGRQDPGGPFVFAPWILLSVVSLTWCHQAINHHMNQCWPRWHNPYGVTRPTWVKRNRSEICSILSFGQAPLSWLWSRKLMLLLLGIHRLRVSFMIARVVCDACSLMFSILTTSRQNGRTLSYVFIFIVMFFPTISELAQAMLWISLNPQRIFSYPGLE